MTYINKKLQGLRVLVTRPQPQGEELGDMIRLEGGTPILFPVIDILPPTDMAAFENNVTQLDQFDYVIFISPQAVLHSAVQFKKNWPVFPDKVKIAAIGGSTAKLLQDAQFPIPIVPEENWCSEGLLALSKFQHVKNKKILIISGEGGRDLLTATLTQRGAHVTETAAYKRALPKLKNKPEKSDVILCTSNEGMINLKKLMGENVTKTPLLVISKRMMTHAQKLGFQNIFLAKNASHHAILEALENAKGSIMNTQAEDNSTVKETPRSSFWAVMGILFSCLSVIALAVAAYFAYFYVMDMNKKTAVNLSAMSDKIQHIQQNMETVQQQSQQLTDDIKNQAQVVTALQQTQGTNKDVWAMLEAQYLVKLASSKLQFENDIATAIFLLQAADQDIRDLTNEKIVAIRQVLAADIAALQATPQVDMIGVYARLSALSEQVDKLPLPVKLAAQDTQSVSVNEKLPWWKRGLEQTWAALSKVVIVRYNPNGTLPLITPEQQEFLSENLHAVLEKSMWALLHKQSDIYKSSLQQALQWTQKYYVQDSPVTQAIIKELTALQEIDIHPDAPKTLASIAAFQDYFNAHQQGV